MKLTRILLAFLFVSCSHAKTEQQPKGNDRLNNLIERFRSAKYEAESIRNPGNGWLVEDCDGMLWTGKYAAVTGVSDVNIAAAETSPGKFVRRPEGCTSANPDWSDWSRDQGAGLLAYIWRKADLAMLKRHIAYGEAHPIAVQGVPAWKMGDPLGDARGVYPPAFIGRLFQTQLALGGDDNTSRFWPDLYPSGLVDYEAHLQVMNIWHRAEVAEFLRTGMGPSTPGTQDDAGASLNLTDISGTMLDKLKEQAERDPRDPLFQAIYGIYTGDMGPAIEALLADDWYSGEYVRCDEIRKCQLAAWLFASDIVIRRFNK